jgi:hypothetical protein
MIHRQISLVKSPWWLVVTNFHPAISFNFFCFFHLAEVLLIISVLLLL